MSDIKRDKWGDCNGCFRRCKSYVVVDIPVRKTIHNVAKDADYTVEIFWCRWCRGASSKKRNKIYKGD